MKRPLVASCCSLALMLSVAHAQAPAPGGPGGARPPIGPVDPAALPGDYVDATIDQQLHVPLGAPPGGRPNSPPPADTTPGLPAALAFEAAKMALDTCLADGYHVSVAVTDASGHLKAAVVADGAGPNRVYMAIRKDITAAAFNSPTLALREKFAADPSLLAQLKPNMAVLPGAIPITVGDHVVGAIASSGAFAYEEEKCVKAGLQEIQPKLK